MQVQSQPKESTLSIAVNYVIQKLKKEDQFLENDFISLQKLNKLHNEDNLEMELNFESKIKKNQDQIELAKSEIKEYLSLKNSQLIGFGCQSYVFSSVDHNMNRYAVKCFNICKNDSEEIDSEKLKKAEFEAQVLLNNRNQNVVYCFKSVKGNKFYLIQLEQCVGTLSELKEQIGHLGENQFIQYFIDLMKGLKFTQNNKMINRDLKPDNILIGFDGRLKLSDFGLSYQLQSFSNKYASSIEGNCYHFAPELMDENIKKMIKKQTQFESKQSFKTDSFAAGLILLNLICDNSNFNYYHLLFSDEYVQNMQFSWLDHFKLKNPIVQMLKSLLAFYPWQRADPDQILQQFEDLINQNPQNLILKTEFFFDPLSSQDYQKLQQIKCGNFIPVNQYSSYLLPFNYVYSLAQKKYNHNQIQQQNQNQLIIDCQNQMQQKILSLEQKMNQISGQVINSTQINQFCTNFNQKIQNLANQQEQNFKKIQQIESSIFSQMQKTDNYINQLDQKIQQQINQFSNKYVDSQTYNSNFQQLKQDFEMLRQQLNENQLTVNNEIQDFKQQFTLQYQQIQYLHQAIQFNNANNCQNDTNYQQQQNPNYNINNNLNDQNINQANLPHTFQVQNQNITPNLITNQNAQQDQQNFYQKQQTLYVNQNENPQNEQKQFQITKQEQQTQHFNNQNYQNQNNQPQNQQQQQQQQFQITQQQYQQQTQQINNQNQINSNEYLFNQQKQFQVTQQQQSTQSFQNDQQQQQFLVTQQQYQQQTQQIQNQNQQNITPNLITNQNAQQDQQNFYQKQQTLYVNSNELPQNEQKQFQITKQQQQTQHFNNQNQQNQNNYPQQQQFQITQQQQQQQTQQIYNQNQINSNEQLFNQQKQFQETQQQQYSQKFQNQNQIQQNENQFNQQKQFQVTDQHQQTQQINYQNQQNQNQQIQQNLNQQNLNQDFQIQEKQFFKQQEELKQNQEFVKPLYKNYSQQYKIDKEDQMQQQLYKSQPLKIKEPDYNEQLTDITSQVKKFFQTIKYQMASQFTKETILQSYFKEQNQMSTHIFMQGFQFPQNIQTPKQKEEYYQNIAKDDNLPNNCKFIKVIKLFNKNYYIQFGNMKNYEKQDINEDQYKQFLVLFDQIKNLQEQQQKQQSN
ncbi:kinase domain protein (macronuclear) [Tetrahymena thermophila SB210]|uniref:non-specific serine/threonine protein kinase n=1 Tax=Tetrahymena thermophila (strain SB210) TaxID=312017 RepID=Q233W6_TETTS|nr:kinase domain protein [Tetrahymena thermophila SB210]EAR91818.1 kinase domain protein [Tetrahymena thermophila SB210]|eukprot:XP_001012063.1 kinase domain protein [Tetrahymena thermophila SB210]